MLRILLCPYKSHDRINLLVIQGRRTCQGRLWNRWSSWRRTWRPILRPTKDILLNLGQVARYWHFFPCYLFPQSALTSATEQMPLLGFLRPPYIVAWFERWVDMSLSWFKPTSVSRVVPDWDLWRTLYRLSYSALVHKGHCNGTVVSMVALYLNVVQFVWSWYF